MNYVQLFISKRTKLVFLTGVSIDKVASLDQETRNYVGRKLLHLTLMELFVFRFMQACCLNTFQ